MCGTDLPVPECSLTVHQPTIKEISLIGGQEFLIGAQCLSLYKSMFTQQGKDVLANTNNFQIFMTIMSAKEEEARKKRASVEKVLTLLFPRYKVLITPMSLVLMKDGENTTIDGDNFEYLQNIFRMIFCSKNGPMDQQAFNPANDKAKEIANKLMRGRERIAAENGSSNSDVFSQYISILTIGLNSMSLEDLTNLTMFQLYDLVERYNLYLAWDIDVRSRLAGAKPDSRPDNWMKNIH